MGRGLSRGDTNVGRCVAYWPPLGKGGFIQAPDIAKFLFCLIACAVRGRPMRMPMNQTTYSVYILANAKYGPLRGIEIRLLPLRRSSSRQSRLLDQVAEGFHILGGGGEFGADLVLLDQSQGLDPGAIGSGTDRRGLAGGELQQQGQALQNRGVGPGEAASNNG